MIRQREKRRREIRLVPPDDLDAAAGCIGARGVRAWHERPGEFEKIGIVGVQPIGQTGAREIGKKGKRESDNFVGRHGAASRRPRTRPRPRLYRVSSRIEASSLDALGITLSLSNGSHVLRNSGHAVKPEDVARWKLPRKLTFFVG